MKEKIKNMSISWIVLSILYILFGISLAVWPTLVMNVIYYAFGGILLLYGAFAVINFSCGREHKAYALLSLFLGIVSAALGAIMVFYPSMIKNIIFVILGLYITIDSILNIRRVLELRRKTYTRWKIHLLLSMGGAALGIFIASYPLLAEITISRSIGLTLIYVGACDLWTLIQLSFLARSAPSLPSGQEDVAEQ